MNLYVRPRVNRSHNFFYRFLSIDIRNRYSSMIVIADYRILPIFGLSIYYVWICPKFLHILIYSAIGDLSIGPCSKIVFLTCFSQSEKLWSFIQSVTSAIVWLKCWNCKYISHLPQIGLNLFPLPSPPLSLSFKNNFPLNNRCYVCIFETITSE